MWKFVSCSLAGQLLFIRGARGREREDVFSKLQRLFILWAVYGFSFKYVYIRIFLHLFVLDQADGTVLSIVLNFLVKFKF